MNILWLSWKDRHHPLAGGAELVSGEIMQRLVRDGHHVRLLTARYADSQPVGAIDGVEVFRSGNRYSVYWRAYRRFRRELRDWPDVVIDEMNTLPFGAAFYTSKPTVLLAYQLARQVWFYQAPLPVAAAGYLLEPLYLRLMSHRYHVVATESESTRTDLAHYGFAKSSVHVFRVGMALQPVPRLNPKPDNRTVLFLGALRPMKRVLHAVRAFELARDSNPQLRLIIAGDDSSHYARKVKAYASRSRHRVAIEFKGRVSNDERLRLMRAATVILVTSIKEGWGLIVTEANSQGTPAIVYDTDGLRDSVKHQVTGLLVPSGAIRSLGQAVVSLTSNHDHYQQLRQQAWEDSQQYTFEASYQDFLTLPVFKRYRAKR